MHNWKVRKEKQTEHCQVLFEVLLSCQVLYSSESGVSNHVKSEHGIGGFLSVTKYCLQSYIIPTSRIYYMIIAFAINTLQWWMLYQNKLLKPIDMLYYRACLLYNMMDNMQYFDL